MKLSYHFSFASLPGMVKKYIQFVLWGFLLLVVLLEFFVIKSSADLILTARAPAPGAQAQIIRVDFNQYKLIEDRLDKNLQYLPDPIKYTSPFGLAPAE